MNNPDKGKKKKLAKHSIFTRDYIPAIYPVDIKAATMVMYPESELHNSTREPDFHYTDTGIIYYLDGVTVDDSHIQQGGLVHGLLVIYYGDI